MATVKLATATLNLCVLDGCMIQEPSVFIIEVTFKAFFRILSRLSVLATLWSCLASRVVIGTTGLVTVLFVLEKHFLIYS